MPLGGEARAPRPDPVDPTWRGEASKLLKKCTLPVTGINVVDLAITDLGVFEIDKHGQEPMKLIELADGVTVEEITAKTQASFVNALR